MLEQIPFQLRIIALVGSVVVAAVALIALRGEWHKTQLEDQIMMVLLAIGCVEVFFVAIGKIGRLQ